MNKRGIIGFLTAGLGILAVLGILYQLNEPGGRLIPLALLALAFSLIGIYYGFIKREENEVLSRYLPLYFHRSRLQAGAIVFFLLAVALAYWSRIERGGIAHIAEWITPYPEITQVMGVPRVSNEFVWAWIVETPDPLEKVISFYQNEKNIGNWRVIESGRVFIFKKDRHKLTIFLRSKADGTGLLYKLSELK